MNSDIPTAMAPARPRAETVATVRTIPEGDVLTSPTSGRRPSSQFRLRRAPTASKEYQILSSGLEPGLNPNSDGLADKLTSSLHTECQITVVEYNEEQISQYELWNDGLTEFLDKPRPDWVKVRRGSCGGGWRGSLADGAADWPGTMDQLQWIVVGRCQATRATLQFPFSRSVDRFYFYHLALGLATNSCGNVPALEDLLAKHDSNRPKCDWYSDHAFGMY